MSEDPAPNKIREADAAVRALSKCVLAGLKPASGPYAFFHHNAHVLSSLQDCRRIYGRLCAGRALLTKLAYEERRAVPENWPEVMPYPDHAQKLMRVAADAGEHMKLDLESLYVFGGILLDQWAMQAIAIGNVPCKKQHPFRELVDYLDQNENPPLSALWSETKDTMLWLYYQLRFYRNRFIVHANRPWNRMTTRSVFGDDFNLLTPTPPGWLDDDALNAEVKALRNLAPKYIRDAQVDWEKEHPAHLLEVLFENIAQYTKKDREKISSLFGKKGGSTPSFRVLADRIFDFMARATPLLVAAAEANLSSIDLGSPHRTTIR